MDCYYTHDGNDRIREVGGYWDQFAHENGGDNAMSAHVVNTEIWDHVTGLETAGYLNALFFWARRKRRQIVIGYRCNGPAIQRLCSMQINSPDGVSITCAHRILSATGVSPSLSPDVTTGDFDQTPRCSVCCRIKLGDKWRDLYFAPPAHDFRPSYTVCDDCRTDALDVIMDKTGENVISMRAATRE